jgi:hypothetical protein
MAEEQEEELLVNRSDEIYIIYTYIFNKGGGKIYINSSSFIIYVER